MPYTRDPVSVMWDAAALTVLRRARAARGGWYGTRLADPGAGQRAALLGLYGIDPDGPDTAAGREARTRWARGFVRAVYYHSRGGRQAIQVEIGRRVPARGVIPAGRAVRVRTRTGGDVAKRAAARLPEDQRIYDASGSPGARWADPDRRDW